ncbi:MAG: LiaF domain-containing protein [Myxococcota bacterium]
MQHPLGDDDAPLDLPRRETLTAVFSSTARHGEWLPPEELRVVVGFGSAKLDLTQALLAPGVTQIEVLAVFGSVELLVPADLEVELGASALFGAVERRGARGGVSGFLRDQIRRVTGTNPEPLEPDDDPPLLRITGHAIFGSITVRVR